MSVRSTFTVLFVGCLALAPVGCARHARIERNRAIAENQRAEADRARAEAEAIRAQTAEEYYEGDAPPSAPAAREDPRPASPGATYIWIAGCHVWRSGHYVWVPGRWASPPRHGAAWTVGHWERRGPHRHVWVAAHWR